MKLIRLKKNGNWYKLGREVTVDNFEDYKMHDRPFTVLINKNLVERYVFYYKWGTFYIRSWDT